MSNQEYGVMDASSPFNRSERLIARMFSSRIFGTLAVALAVLLSVLLALSLAFAVSDHSRPRGRSIMKNVTGSRSSFIIRIGSGPSAAESRTMMESP